MALANNLTELRQHGPKRNPNSLTIVTSHCWNVATAIETWVAHNGAATAAPNLPPQYFAVVEPRSITSHKSSALRPDTR